MAVNLASLYYGFFSYSDKNNYFCIIDENYYSYEVMQVAINEGSSREDFVELPILNLSIIRRNFLKSCHVNRYKMKKIFDLSDNQLREACKSYCYENNLIQEWKKFKIQDLFNLLESQSIKCFITIFKSSLHCDARINFRLLLMRK